MIIIRLFSQYNYDACVLIGESTVQRGGGGGGGGHPTGWSALREGPTRWHGLVRALTLPPFLNSHSPNSVPLSFPPSLVRMQAIDMTEEGADEEGMQYVRVPRVALPHERAKAPHTKFVASLRREQDKYALLRLTTGIQHVARVTDYHTDMITRVVYVPAVRAYVSGGRDGTVRTWDSVTLQPQRTIQNSNKVMGARLVTDVMLAETPGPMLPMAVSSYDKSITLYDASRSTMVSQLHGKGPRGRGGGARGRALLTPDAGPSVPLLPLLSLLPFPSLTPSIPYFFSSPPSLLRTWWDASRTWSTSPRARTTCAAAQAWTKTSWRTATTAGASTSSSSHSGGAATKKSRGPRKSTPKNWRE